MQAVRLAGDGPPKAPRDTYSYIKSECRVRVVVRVSTGENRARKVGERKTSYYLDALSAKGFTGILTIPWTIYKLHRRVAGTERHLMHQAEKSRSASSEAQRPRGSARR